MVPAGAGSEIADGQLTMSWRRLRRADFYPTSAPKGRPTGAAQRQHHDASERRG